MKLLPIIPETKLHYINLNMYLKVNPFILFSYTVFSFNIVLQAWNSILLRTHEPFFTDEKKSFSNPNFVRNISDYTSFILNLSKSKICTHALSVQKRYISMVEEKLILFYLELEWP